MADGTAPASIGHNAPPEPTPFEAIKVHLDDLLTEAYAWADGTTVENQAQADEASRLIDELRKGAKAADEVRVEEKKPHDDAIAEIQARFNVYIADPKNKQPGKVWKAIDALKACVKPFLEAEEKKRREAAAEAQRKANEAAQAAADAARAAQASDLASRDAAEELVQAANKAAADARAIENSRAQARGGERALGLRKTFTPAMIDRKTALLHYAATRPEDLAAFLQQLAVGDVREGKRSIPGFEIAEGTAL